MNVVNDNDHVLNVDNIVHVCKVGDFQLAVCVSMPSSQQTLTFDSKGKRNTFFDAVVAKLTTP